MLRNKSIKIAVILILCFCSAMVKAIVYEPNLPSDFPELSIFWTDKAAPGVLIGNLGKKGAYRIILDEQGYPLFYSLDENFVSKSVVSNGLIAGVDKKAGRFFLKDETFTIVDSFAGTNDRCFIMLPNGHAITASGGDRQIDMSQIVAGGRPDALLQGKSFLEMDANKQIVFEWNCLDYIPLTETLADLTDKTIDFTHLNYVNIDSLDHNYLISDRHACSIIKVSRISGDILWRLGGPANDFTFIGEHEENAPYYFAAQHSVQSLPNGNILFFDNGGAGADLDIPERSYSRAVEYQLDEVNMTATLVWEYRHDPDIYASSGGDVRRLDNGNTFINWGAAVRTGDNPIVTEVTSAGEVAFEMWFTDPAQANDKCIIDKHLWNSPEQVHSETFHQIENSQIYNSTQAGVSLVITDLEASPEYSGLVVKKHDVAVRFPKFSGKAPWVLQKRVTLDGFGVTYMTADVSFNTNDLGCDEPSILSVYHRSSVGQGEFTPLETIYDDVAGTLTVKDVSFGEFIFGYPDLPEIALPPILQTPKEQALVNQTQPVTLQWTPKGFGRSYHVQVATDDTFTNLIVDEPNIKEFSYTLASVDPNTTYSWRINTTNYGGTSEWAVRSFTATEPMIHVTVPDGGQVWQRGLDYFIQWDTNLSEDVVIELYKADSFIETIATAPNIGAYEWNVDLTLAPGNDYSIKIKSSVNGAIIDSSDTVFTIN